MDEKVKWKTLRTIDELVAGGGMKRVVIVNADEANENVDALLEQLDTLLHRDIAHQKRGIYLETRVGELEAGLAEKDGRIAALRMKLQDAERGAR